MTTSVSNITQSLAAALKDVQRLEVPEAKKKQNDAPAESVAKAVIVYISIGAKMQIFKDTLNKLQVVMPLKQLFPSDRLADPKLNLLGTQPK